MPVAQKASVGFSFITPTDVLHYASLAALPMFGALLRRALCLGERLTAPHALVDFEGRGRSVVETIIVGERSRHGPKRTH